MYRCIIEYTGHILVSHTVGVQFILSLGDNFYPDGPASVTDPLFNTRWEDVYTGDAIKVGCSLH